MCQTKMKWLDLYSADTKHTVHSTPWDPLKAAVLGNVYNYNSWNALITIKAFFFSGFLTSLFVLVFTISKFNYTKQLMGCFVVRVLVWKVLLESQYLKKKDFHSLLMLRTWMSKARCHSYLLRQAECYFKHLTVNGWKGIIYNRYFCLKAKNN